MDLTGFKIWLEANKSYSKDTIGDIASRIKRACGIMPWSEDDYYLHNLEIELNNLDMKPSIKSQIKKSASLYNEYQKDILLRKKNYFEGGEHMKVLSLFANIGVAEALLKDTGYKVAIANELIERRARLYSSIYPETNMICGDITNDEIRNKIVDESIAVGIDIVMATPPCQGMSTAGLQCNDDDRNQLILPVIDIIKRVKPKYVFIENVPMFMNTEISFDGSKKLITSIIKSQLASDYEILDYIIDTKDYSVPQTRERAIILMTRKSINLNIWTIPEKDSEIVTMEAAIGHLPILDPFINDVLVNELLQIFPKYYERCENALAISKWHVPPHHVKRQVDVMRHTPTGATAFDNDIYFPIKQDGEPVKGYRNTYKRQNWHTPAYTVTMDNRKISSQNNVHPGRLEYIDDDGYEIYSDPRALTLYELMIIMSIPDDWPIPEGTSEAFLRRIIGEGIPPLFLKKVFQNIK